MKNLELVILGIKGSVVALDRTTGRQVWVARLKGMDFVNVVLQSDTVFATCCGEIFCLDVVTGTLRWHNPLKGFGRGLATIATDATDPGAQIAVLAQKRLRDEQAAASGAATAAA